MSLADLNAISTDPQATADALDYDNIKLGTGEPAGDELLRQRVAGLYDQTKATVTADDVVIANGTTGSISFILQGLLSPGDHVITLYPVYEGLIDFPRGLGADMSYWRLSHENGWKGDIEQLKSLLRPTTKMIIINNPHNPTGAVFTTAEQAEIVKIAKERNIILFCDEIFRPLFHAGGKIPTSLLEHSTYDRTVVAGSLSKVWGFGGVRIGWVVTRDRQIREACLKVRKWMVLCVSVADEIIAREVLSERCKDKIIANTLANARVNLSELETFVRDYKDSVSCVLPAGSATAFVKFADPKSGQPVDDVDFCVRLKKEVGVLLSPGSMCFGQLNEGDFKGFVRMHITIPPETFQKGIDGIAKFLTSQTFQGLSINGH